MSLLAKIVYSVLLLGITGVLLREFWLVWFDSRIYIGQFDVVSETGKDDAASSTFPHQIISAQAILGMQLNDYQTRHADAISDATFVLPGMTPLLLPPEALAGVDITVQNINLRQIFTSVRKGFLSPNEVRGNVSVRKGSVLAAVDWPHAPRLHASSALTKFLVPAQASHQAAAAYIASSLVWARAANTTPSIESFSRTQFCDFSAGLDDLYTLSAKASSPSGLDATESSLVRKRAAQLRAHYSNDIVFPELYRLRADLLDLLPEQDRKQAELVEAQEDRLRYAMHSPKLRNLPEEEKRFAALALARPAILIKKDGSLTPPENWISLLRHHEPEIRLASNSVGLLLIGEQPCGTGCIVAPGLLLTASHSIDYAKSQTAATVSGNQAVKSSLRLCLGTDKASCTDVFELTDVVYDGKSVGSNITLVNFNGYQEDQALAYPPLPVMTSLPAANSLNGRYAYVVGYPFLDTRLPQAFLDKLLGKDQGRKRLMPGRILALGQTEVGIGFLENQDAHPKLKIFTTDISTSGGTSGSPLLDLATGQIIGMSYAGKWKGERGKFAYAEILPKEVLDIIVRRLQGEPNPSMVTKK